MSRYGSKYKSKPIHDRNSSTSSNTPIDLPLTIGSVIDVLSQDNKSVGDILVTIKKSDGTFKNEVASPMSPHFISIPLPNERVTLMQDIISSKWYYLTSISRGGNVNHMSNAVKRVFEKDTSTLYTGKTFTPNPSLRALNIYEGDTIFQGRAGQSIRFGSKNEATNSPWSVDGEEGAPIIAIRSGITQIENLDVDFSSIYLTAGQSLPIVLKSALPKTYTRPDLYDNNQIVLTSDRVMIYTREEDIVLSSATEVGISTSKWAVDVSTLIDQIAALCDHVITIAGKVSDQGLYSATSTMISGPPGSPTSPSNNAGQFNMIYNEAASVKSQVQQIKNNIDNMKQ